VTRALPAARVLPPRTAPYNDPRLAPSATACTERASLAPGECEGAPLGVPADRPLLARVDDLAAECLDAGERLPDVGDGEVRKREAVAGPWPALVQSERNSAFPRLPAASLPLLALGERDLEQPLPEPTSALWVVCGKLDERELDHAAIVAPLIVIRRDQFPDRQLAFVPKQLEDAQTR